MDDLGRTLIMKNHKEYFKMIYQEGYKIGFREGLKKSFEEGAERGELESNLALLKNNIISKPTAVKYSNVDLDTFEKFYDAYLEGKDVFLDMWKKSKASDHASKE